MKESHCFKRFVRLVFADTPNRISNAIGFDKRVEISYLSIFRSAIFLYFCVVLADLLSYTVCKIPRIFERVSPSTFQARYSHWD